MYTIDIQCVAMLLNIIEVIGHAGLCCFFEGYTGLDFCVSLAFWPPGFIVVTRAKNPHTVFFLTRRRLKMVLV
jgi:hypothetical protein